MLTSFPAKKLKEIELIDYPKKVKISKYKSDYLQTVLDLGRSYFYINGIKCSINFIYSIEEAQKQIGNTVNKISKFNSVNIQELTHFILLHFSLNQSLADLSQLMSDCKKRCIDAYTEKEKSQWSLSSSLSKSLYYLEIDDNANPLILHEFRVLILENTNGLSVPMEFLSSYNFKDSNASRSSYNQGNFKFSDHNRYLATENDLLLKIKAFSHPETTEIKP